jgi:hypothetical protein
MPPLRHGGIIEIGVVDMIENVGEGRHGDRQIRKGAPAGNSEEAPHAVTAVPVRVRVK